MWIEVSLALLGWQLTVIQVAVTGLGWRLTLLAGEDINSRRWWMDIPPGVLGVQIQPWAGKLYLGVRILGVWISHPLPLGQEPLDVREWVTGRE